LRKVNSIEQEMAHRGCKLFKYSPFLLGIEQSGLLDQIDLVKDYPSKIAQSLIEDTIDIGLVPVAIIPLLKEAHFISDYCIGAEQEVASVAIFSDVPMDQIEKVYLDHQSRTSVQLARLMMKLYWEKEVEWIAAEPDYIEKLGEQLLGSLLEIERWLLNKDFLMYLI